MCSSDLSGSSSFPPFLTWGDARTHTHTLSLLYLYADACLSGLRLPPMNSWKARVSPIGCGALWGLSVPRRVPIQERSGSPQPGRGERRDDLCSCFEEEVGEVSAVENRALTKFRKSRRHDTRIHTHTHTHTHTVVLPLSSWLGAVSLF